MKFKKHLSRVVVAALVLGGLYYLRRPAPAPARVTPTSQRFAVTGSLVDEFGKRIEPEELVVTRVEKGSDFDPDFYQDVEEPSIGRGKMGFLVLQIPDGGKKHFIWIPFDKNQADPHRLEGRELLMSNHWTESPDWEVEHWIEYKRATYSVKVDKKPDGTSVLDLDYTSYEVDDNAKHGVYVRKEGVTVCDHGMKNCRPQLDVVYKGKLTLQKEAKLW